MTLCDVHDPHRHGAEQPLVGVRTQQIHMRANHIEGKCPQSLDRIQCEKNPPRFQQGTNRLDLETVTAEKMATRQGHQSGPLRQRARHQFRRNLSRDLGT